MVTENMKMKQLQYVVKGKKSEIVRNQRIGCGHRKRDLGVGCARAAAPSRDGEMQLQTLVQ